MQDIRKISILFKSDNLDALIALQDTHLNSIKCVYLDPPYNTGINRTHFEDDKKSAEWILMMSKRLNIIKKLMRQDASIWISIDDSELYNLKNLCDEIFGKENFVANFTWQHKINWDGYKGKCQLDHSYILCYSKSNEFNFENTIKPSTVWLESEAGGQTDAIRESKMLFGEKNTFSTPKPERLMNKILELSTKKGDIVLDGFSGSGTMGAAAQKMERYWIMIEIGEQCETHILPRIKQLATQFDIKELNLQQLSSKYFFYSFGIKDYLWLHESLKKLN